MADEPSSRAAPDTLGAPTPSLESDPQAISTEALRKAESYVEAEEGATNRLAGWAGTVPRASRS